MKDLVGTPRMLELIPVSTGFPTIQLQHARENACRSTLLWCVELFQTPCPTAQILFLDDL